MAARWPSGLQFGRACDAASAAAAGAHLTCVSPRGDSPPLLLPSELRSLPAFMLASSSALRAATAASASAAVSPPCTYVCDPEPRGYPKCCDPECGNALGL